MTNIGIETAEQDFFPFFLAHMYNCTVSLLMGFTWNSPSICGLNGTCLGTVIAGQIRVYGTLPYKYMFNRVEWYIRYILGES